MHFIRLRTCCPIVGRGYQFQSLKTSLNLLALEQRGASSFINEFAVDGLKLNDDRENPLFPNLPSHHMPDRLYPTNEGIKADQLVSIVGYHLPDERKLTFKKFVHMWIIR